MVMSNAITYAKSDAVPKFNARQGISAHSTRYIFTLGDFIPSQDKRQLNSIGAWAGGMYLGTTEFKTAFRTNHFLIRGALTPLEKRGWRATEDMATNDQMRTSVVSINGVQVQDRFYEVLPGHELEDGMSAGMRDQGVVEITTLRGVEWDTNAPLEIQTAIFPDWDLWLSGEKPFPQYFRDWMEHLEAQQAQKQDELVYETISQMLESGRTFKVYAENIIGQNRKLVQAGANPGGYSIGWQPLTRVFADQLQIELEPETQVKNIAQTQTDSVVATNEALLMLANQLAADRAEMKEQAKQNTEILKVLLAGASPAVKENVSVKAVAEAVAEVEAEGDIEDGTDSTSTGD